MTVVSLLAGLKPGCRRRSAIAARHGEVRHRLYLGSEPYQSGVANNTRADAESSTTRRAQTRFRKSKRSSSKTRHV
jgi:hypothetical protein